MVVVRGGGGGDRWVVVHLYEGVGEVTVGCMLFYSFSCVFVFCGFHILSPFI